MANTVSSLELTSQFERLNSQPREHIELSETTIEKKVITIARSMMESCHAEASQPKFYQVDSNTGKVYFRALVHAITGEMGCVQYEPDEMTSLTDKVEVRYTLHKKEKLFADFQELRNQLRKNSAEFSISVTAVKIILLIEQLLSSCVTSTKRSSAELFLNIKKLSQIEDKTICDIWETVDKNTVGIAHSPTELFLDTSKFSQIEDRTICDLWETVDKNTIMMLHGDARMRPLIGVGCTLGALEEKWDKEKASSERLHLGQLVAMRRSDGSVRLAFVAEIGQDAATFVVGFKNQDNSVFVDKKIARFEDLYKNVFSS